MDDNIAYHIDSIIDAPFQIFGRMMFPGNDDFRNKYIKYQAVKAWSLVAKANGRNTVAFKPTDVIEAMGTSAKDYQDAFRKNTYLGSICGQILLFLSHLAHTKPDHASVSNAICLTEAWGTKNKAKINTVACWNAWRQFATVRHFWAAYGSRGWEFSRDILEDPALSVKFDFLSFVGEAKKRKAWCEGFDIADNSAGTIRKLLSPNEGWWPPDEMVGALSENPRYAFPETDPNYMPAPLSGVELRRSRRR